jgi:citrate synthase
MAQVRGWLTASEAAQRLGVKPATLYAYVSRGLLSRRTGTAGRSQFDPVEIDRLARHGRAPRRPAGAEVVIASAVTTLGEDRPFYRGRDATELAVDTPYEAVAEWLWTGQSISDSPSWTESTDAVRVARAAQSGLAADVSTLERLLVAVPALASADPRRANLDPSAVPAQGRALIAGMIASLPGDPVTGTIAQRLWSRLTGTAANRRGRTAQLVDALRAAMVLLADHELAASTLAARVAASVRADPYNAVTAGLATLSGPMHGGASLGMEALLDEALRRPTAARSGPAGGDDAPARASELIGLRLRRGERIPGFGHAVYRPSDGRCTVLLGLVRAARPDGDPALAVADALLAEGRRRGLPEPNIDFALAVLTRVAGMPIGSGEAIFAIARTAGWLAHTMEEYERPTRLRLRAVHHGR